MDTFKPKDHDEWLEFRRQHLTSTELAKLHLHKQTNTWVQLRQEKQTGHALFQGNQYTDWGSAREPLLAEWMIKEVDSRLVYNEEPQTIVINPEDSRLCGTPDLLPGGDCIGEIKTGGHEWEGGRYDTWVPNDYYLQCQLNMWHTGADACVILVERHEEFVPVSTQRATIMFNPNVIEELKVTAAEWFAWLDGTPPEWLGEVTDLETLDVIEDVAGAYLDLKNKIDKWQTTLDEYKERLFELLPGDSSSTTVGTIKVTVSNVPESVSFDSTKFKKENPDMYAKYHTKKRKGYKKLKVSINEQ